MAQFRTAVVTSRQQPLRFLAPNPQTQLEPTTDLQDASDNLSSRLAIGAATEAWSLVQWAVNHGENLEAGWKPNQTNVQATDQARDDLLRRTGEAGRQAYSNASNAAANCGMLQRNSKASTGHQGSSQFPSPGQSNAGPL